LQVKLCDPCLSALCVPWCKKALYKYSSFPFPFLDANVDTLTFHYHGGLAFIHRRPLKLQKTRVDVAVNTFEFPCGLVPLRNYSLTPVRFCDRANCHFIRHGVYRPGSQPLSTAFFDDLSTTSWLKPNSITLAGPELVRSWFELKFGLSSSLLAAN